MITISVDLTAATPDEAKAYSQSITLQFLVNIATEDLARRGIKLTSIMNSGSHAQLSSEESAAALDGTLAEDEVVADARRRIDLVRDVLLRPVREKGLPIGGRK